MKVTPEPGYVPEQVLRQLAAEFERLARESDAYKARHDRVLEHEEHEYWEGRATWERGWAKRLRKRATQVEKRRSR